MDITSYLLWKKNTSLLPLFTPLSATSDGCTKDVISIISCTDLGISLLLECRGCLELINYSLPLQGTKNNPMADTSLELRDVKFLVPLHIPILTSARQSPLQ